MFIYVYGVGNIISEEVLKDIWSNMSAILMVIKMCINGIGFLSTYFSIGDHKIYVTGWLVGSMLMLISIAIPEEWKRI